MYGYTIFHEKIMNTLLCSVRENKTSNTYIFEGADGMYKHEAAKLFANALVCEHSSSAPCGECRSCIEAKAGTNPDIITVQHETGSDGKPKKSIGVDSARSTVNSAAVKPFNSSKKVYIIPDGENLTIEAQNAFLKTLEEPPEYVVFIIILQNSSILLPTVLSRACIIKFPPVNNDIIRRYIIEKYPQEHERCDFLVKYCEGIPGNVDDIIADENFEALRNDSLSVLPDLLSDDLSRAFLIEDFSDKHKDCIKSVIDILISYLRDISVIHYGAAEKIINSDKTDILRRLSREFDTMKCMNTISNLVTAQNMISKSVKLGAVMLKTALNS